MRIRRLAAMAVAVVSLAGLAACSGASASNPPAGATGSTCGTTRTGANVPVVIKVAKGRVNCAAAMKTESGYATAIKEGKVPGNGGGAPVAVGSWTCEGYATPDVLRTGNASECHEGGAEIVAVIALPSSATSSGS
jgi:hypothetical protein